MSRSLKAFLLLVFLAAGLWFAWKRQRPFVEGFAYAVDGDSLKVAGADIRLEGVDAPEMRQSCTRAGTPYACGVVARDALIGRIGGRRLACRATGRDRYWRTLAVCSAAGIELNAWLVEQGYAVGYRGYEREEARARAARRGLWAGDFERPAAWRRARETPSP